MKSNVSLATYKADLYWIYSKCYIRECTSDRHQLQQKSISSLCDQLSRKTVQEAIDARDLRPHPMDDNLRKAKPRELNHSAPTDPQTITLPPPSASTFSVLGKLAVLLQARTTQTVAK